MEWSDLRYFLAVARNGRLAVAARGLGVEHTTVGRRIAALEAALGTPLFHRTAAGWRLTRVGEQIVPKAEVMEAQARELMATSYAAAAKTAGRVRIACVESWAVGLLGPALPALRARHPELQVELLTGQAPMNLTRGEADIAFRVPRPKQPDLSATSFGDGTVGLYGARTLVDRYRRAIEAGNARGVPLAIYTPDMDFLQSAPWFRALIEHAEIVLRTPSTMALIAIARSGQAIVPAARFVVDSDVLVPCGSRDLAKHRLWCVAHKDVRRDPRVAAVFEWARLCVAPLVHERERRR